MRPFSRNVASSRGFTLIELGMVIGILVLIAAIAVPSLEAVFGVKTREEVTRIAGSIRAMYGESVLSGRTCRLVFDLEEGAYWPECAEGKVRVAAMEDSLRGKRVEEKARDFGGTEEEKEARSQVEARNAFAAYSAGLAPRRTLREGVSLESVWTQHQSEPYTAGQAYLYFFPGGRSERAYLHVGDGSDTWTIIVDPATGRARVLPEKVPVPSKELRP